MTEPLTYHEAEEIFQEMQSHTDKSDPDIAGIYDNLYRQAIQYANIRARWPFLSKEEKMETDSRRTSLHDAFITSVNIVSRLQAEAGARWRVRLGDDRKRIGDFACFMALFFSIEAR
ncbi:MAG: hypothetical protein ACLU6W_00945 [Lachnospiraceae bacterium]|nr:hypothetical protein [Candidatus Fimimorpha excrementavium]